MDPENKYYFIYLASLHGLTGFLDSYSANAHHQAWTRNPN